LPNRVAWQRPQRWRGSHPGTSTDQPASSYAAARIRKKRNPQQGHLWVFETVANAVGFQTAVLAELDQGLPGQSAAAQEVEH